MPMPFYKVLLDSSLSPDLGCLTLDSQAIDSTREGSSTGAPRRLIQ